MSQDGAHLGYGAEAAMRGVIGGEEPPKRMDVTEMREYIMAAPESAGNYDDCARIAAKVVLGVLDTHPQAVNMPADSKHEWPKKPDGSTDWDAEPTITELGLYEFIRDSVPDAYARLDDLGLTGFQWGWAVNAARRCCELPPVPNPAILEIG